MSKYRTGSKRHKVPQWRKQIAYDAEFQAFLEKFLTSDRMEVMKQTLDNRTRHLTIAIEDIYHPHNASAVVRTCDAFGIQDLHIIENRNKYRMNPKVALGSGQWIDIIKHNEAEHNSAACVRHLKEKGYKVIATTPHTEDISLYDLKVDDSVALIFGNEKDGISDEVRNEVDGFMRIPMYGFAESFNISVSAAICLSVLTEKLRKTDIQWQLSEEEKKIILFEWTKHKVGTIDKYLHEFKRLQNEA
ncbi:TrmH family RNA methyltransferase [Parvicella tangerina]|uniref:tRNA (guanosine(18)-2'-O)-methyltransferase n=1 Tax=Parvicella tangerina TaxID=2829795 RepID=A0A916JM55_9FLAO|nr:RNA methyltransferase [Parvicella tangerina]CAG5080404.1 tRNA (guanosine(18)-2'-O)-methyltransferase [Parvicella tangerina]